MAVPLPPQSISRFDKVPAVLSKSTAGAPPILASSMIISRLSAPLRDVMFKLFISNSSRLLTTKSAPSKLDRWPSTAPKLTLSVTVRPSAINSTDWAQIAFDWQFCMSTSSIVIETEP